MKATILKDIISGGKTKTCYAKRLDLVKVIEIRGEAVIVENKKGERFSVNKIELKINQN